MLRSLLFVTAAAFPGAALAQNPPPPAPPAGATAAQPRPAPGATTVESVTVTGQRNDLRSGIDRRSYSVAGDLQATTGSIADALRNVPGLEVDVQGNVSLRGDQNVTIMVDGRPAAMFRGEGRADALQALPADQIDRIEVMTNPSAAFSPEGSGGVINLVTKKNRRAGRYATLRGSVGTGQRGGLGASGAYTGQKLTLSGDLGYRRLGSPSTSENERVSLVGGQPVESRQRGEVENTGDILFSRVGLEYKLDDATQVTADLSRFGIDIDFEGLTRFEFEDPAGAVVRAFDRRLEGGFERTSTAASTSLRRRFSGTEHELAAEFNVEQARGSRHREATTNEAGGLAYEQFRNDDVQDQARLKVDYNRPVGEESRLKTGYEFESQKNDYDYFGRRGPSRETATVDPNLTNVFAYDRAVHGLYATYERPFGRKLRAQGGLRLEQTFVDITSITVAQTEENDDFSVYPTLHLRYELDETQQLSASYSRRVQRPQPQDLNPFVVVIDPFNLRAGNPRLEPQVTDSFELGWQKRKGPTYYLATLFYRDSRDGVTDVVRDIGGGVLLTTRENLAERRSAGLELVANGRVTPKLTYNVNGNLLWEEIGASSVPGFGFSEARSGASVGGRANLNWQPTEKDFFQLNAMVVGRRLQPQGYREPTGMLNLGYRRKVNDKLSLLVTAQDVLGSFRDVVVIDTPTLQDRFERTQSNRAVFLGFSYTFSEGPRRPQREPGFEFETGGGAPPT